jgi:hypothetical protein
MSMLQQNNEIPFSISEREAAIAVLSRFVDG